MEALIFSLIVAVIVCAVIYVVAMLITRHLPIPAEFAWLVWLIAILLMVLVLLRVIWPHI